jgi:drug/metabolite transporter (DMT)-like permease
MRLLLLTSLAMCAFAANSVITRLALKGHAIGALDFAAIRLASGAVALAMLAMVLRRGLPIVAKARGWGPLALLTYVLGFSIAYLALDAGVGALILFGGVQVTMFLGALVGGEAVPLRRWIGAALAFAGLIWLLVPQSGISGPALMPVLAMGAAAAGWGIYSLIGRRGGDPLAATAANFIVATPFAVFLALAWRAPPEAPALTIFGILLALLSGIVTSGLGYALWYQIVPRLGATRAAVAQLSVPVIAALGGIVTIGEQPGLRFALAAGLVLGGVAVASR